MNFGLTKEQELLQKAAKEFSEKMILPVSEQIDRENETPKEILEGLSELGMFGLAFPEVYGGGDAGWLSYILCLEQIAKASSGVGMIMSVNSIPAIIIDKFGSEAQKKTYVPDIVQGKKIGSFAFTEPGTGSDPKQLATTAEKKGNKWVINGTKRFISNADYDGTIVVIAKEAESGKATAFIVDKKCPGYSVSEKWDKIAAHGGPLYDVYFENVEVPEENMLGNIGDGLWILKIAMVYGKIGLVALFLGIQGAAYDEGLNYAREKTHRGVPIGNKFEHIKIAISEMTMKYHSAKLYAYHLGYSVDTLKDPMQILKEAALTKCFVAETGIEVTKIAMNIHGSYGIQRDYKISRLWGDTIVGPQVEGTSPLLKILASGIILGS